MIRKLVHGEADTLDLSDAEASKLVLWTLKTALALHSASNYRRIVPDEHYRTLTEQQTIPDSVKVVGKVLRGLSSFGWVQSTTWMVIQQERLLSEAELVRLKAEGYKICPQIGCLLLLVAYNPLPGTLCFLRKFEHVPLHPRHGPVFWLQRALELESHPVRACFAYHANFGLATLAENPRPPHPDQR